MRRAVRSLIVAAAVLGSLVGCGATGSVPHASGTAAPTRISLPAQPVAYFFGDSWTQGHSAAPGKGYPYVAGAALHWKVVLGPDGSGTGYAHANTAAALTYPQRAKSLPAHIDADVVVLQGGINDQNDDLSKLDGAVRSTVDTLRQRTGGAPIIMLGPAPAALPVSYQLYQIDAQLAADARGLGVPYISPIRGKWIDASNIRSIIDPATAHPDTAGHAYFGKRVAQAIRPLIRQATDSQ